MEETPNDLQRLEAKRPMLTDSAEMEIIRSVYFKDAYDYLQFKEADQLDRFDRMTRKEHFRHKSSR